MSAPYQKETVLKGLPLSGGVAVARVCRFNEKRHSNLEIYKVKGEGIDREIDRFERAVQVAADRIEGVRQEALNRIGPAEAEIFTAQKMILQDPSLHDKVVNLIRRESTNAEGAVMVVLDSYEVRMRELDDEYIRERATDFGEVKRRLLDVLSNMNPVFQCANQGHCQRGRNRIVVAEELTPSLTLELDTRHTMAFVTERGGTNSHAAILARALGIPAVSGIRNIHATIACGSELIVNGHTGEVIVAPTEATVARVRTQQGVSLRAPRPMAPVRGLVVMANISLADEAAEANAMKAEGIGLYRTEFEFMAESRLLSEDEQFGRYAAVVRAMDGKPVTFRMFDAGGDKPFAFLEIRKEDNPALGWRGARLLLDNPLLARTQARAIARASAHGPVNVLYPMVVDLEQFRKLRDMFRDAAGDIDATNLRHGVMFEVPAACLQAKALLQEADFGSIGSNDLIQYMFAVDRNNEYVAHDYSPDRPVFWDVLRTLAGAAKETGKPLSLCGEIAGNPEYVARILDTGISTVSVSSRLIPGARLAAREYLRKRRTPSDTTTERRKGS